MHTKYCKECDTRRQDKFFYKADTYRGVRNLSAYCKRCTQARLKARRDSNPEKQKQYVKGWYHRNREKLLIKAGMERLAMRNGDPAKYRAKKFFDASYRKVITEGITKEILERLFRETKKCQCCGKILQLGYTDRSLRKSWAHPDSPSIDRVNNDKGYTLNNICVICCECNHRKSDITLKILKMFETYIMKYGDL